MIFRKSENFLIEDAPDPNSNCTMIRNCSIDFDQNIAEQLLNQNVPVNPPSGEVLFLYEHVEIDTSCSRSLLFGGKLRKRSSSIFEFQRKSMKIGEDLHLGHIDFMAQGY